MIDPFDVACAQLPASTEERRDVKNRVDDVEREKGAKPRRGSETRRQWEDGDKREENRARLLCINGNFHSICAEFVDTKTVCV